MIEPVPGTAGAPAGDDAAKLRKATSQLEGVFLEQLFKAMRETVPQDGALDGGSGESIFASLLDQHVADAAAAKQENGLGAALYRQLVRQLHGGEGQP
jgi:flagellar protein FlgJ